MAKSIKPRQIYDRSESSTDIASSYVKGEKIKKMLKAGSYQGSKGELLVKLSNVIISLELACYQVDLLGRDSTNKAYDLAMKEGISKLNLNKINR